MDLKVANYPISRNYNLKTSKNFSKISTPATDIVSFGAIKKRSNENYGLVLLLSSLLTLSACSQAKKKFDSSDNPNNLEQGYDYYYLENDTASNSKTIHHEGFYVEDEFKDDNSIQKNFYNNDTLVKQETITPEGISIIIEKDPDSGHNKTTYLYPDSSKTVYNEFKSKNFTKKEKLSYFPNGQEKESQTYTKFLNRKPDKFYEKYNLDGQLLCWYTSEENYKDTTNVSVKYDSKHRIIQENGLFEIHYKYRHNDSLPYKIITINQDCKRITEYDDNHNIINCYFEAKDSTITPESELDKIEW